ncbi:Pectinesterase/pectinesterase inhibitor [Thalictrum thalictroides]|uniref:Pectinesterase n=1 Tax=Thalictrum thalictroides TaxID=46969 RepID=A0A7J6V6V8_THATH|nr:Pectinesterase/pectinesterase inhibitor [Thalictrum thalictroides]
MSKHWVITSLFLLLAISSSCTEEKDDANMVQVVHEAVVGATNWTRSASLIVLKEMENKVGFGENIYNAMNDCVKLYEDSEERLGRLLLGSSYGTITDKLSWLSGVFTSHRTCLDGLYEKGTHFVVPQEAQNLSILLRKALAFYGGLLSKQKKDNMTSTSSDSDINRGFLVSWDAKTSMAHYVVAKDGSGNYRSINEAVKALEQRNRNGRVVIYVKSGVYAENVEIDRNMKNVMFVGDGIDKTVVTGNRNVKDGASTYNSATFIVAGDGFWARDITFENTAGPQNHQAVAITVASDLSVFYRCSFKGYQDTLFVHSLRQFYRDCYVYGTVDFIFGNAAAVLQNCNILVRRPMDHQGNMITAQGRDDPNENTGISIHMSRIAPAPDLEAVKGKFKTFLGRPWKKYSRTVVLKTDLDGLIHPKGWREWRGNFALSTLFYGEYMNSGSGALTGQRVNWPGFHVLNDPREAGQFTVSSFLQGENWIHMTGVPFSPGL